MALYLQQAGVGGLTVDEAGTQTIIQNELAVFLQDSWKPRPNLTVNYGLRWEAQIQPRPDHADRGPVLRPVHRPDGHQLGRHLRVPRGRHDPVRLQMFQPRLGIAYDVKGDGKQVVRANAGLYYARIPGLNLASSRSTDGSRGQNAVPQQRSSPASWGRRRRTASCCPAPAGGPFQPGVFVFDKDFQNPRTFTATVGLRARDRRRASRRGSATPTRAPTT